MVAEKREQINLKDMRLFHLRQYLVYLRSSLGMGMGKAILNQRRRIIQKTEDRLRKLY
jgi:hypothetical protein